MAQTIGIMRQPAFPREEFLRPNTFMTPDPIPRVVPDFERARALDIERRGALVRVQPEDIINRPVVLKKEVRDAAGNVVEEEVVSTLGDVLNNIETGREGIEDGFQALRQGLRTLTRATRTGSAQAELDAMSVQALLQQLADSFEIMTREEQTEFRRAGPAVGITANPVQAGLPVLMTRGDVRDQPTGSVKLFLKMNSDPARPIIGRRGPVRWGSYLSSNSSLSLFSMKSYRPPMRAVDIEEELRQWALTYLPQDTFPPSPVVGEEMGRRMVTLALSGALNPATLAIAGLMSPAEAMALGSAPVPSGERVPPRVPRPLGEFTEAIDPSIFAGPFGTTLRGFRPGRAFGDLPVRTGDLFRPMTPRQAAESRGLPGPAPPAEIDEEILWWGPDEVDDA